MTGAVVILLAAGEGERIGRGPKAFLQLAGRPILTYAAESAVACPQVDGLVVAVPPGAEEKAQRTGQTLRLRKEAWRQLRQLALELEAQRDTRVHQHDLLIEAVNDLFRKYDRPPIA